MLRASECTRHAGQVRTISLHPLLLRGAGGTQDSRRPQQPGLKRALPELQRSRIIATRLPGGPALMGPVVDVPVRECVGDDDAQVVPARLELAAHVEAPWLPEALACLLTVQLRAAAEHILVMLDWFQEHHARFPDEFDEWKARVRALQAERGELDDEEEGEEDDAFEPPCTARIETVNGRRGHRPIRFLLGEGHTTGSRRSA